MTSRFELEHLGHCPACGVAARALLHDDCTDLVVGSSDEAFSLWRCLRCRSAYLDPRPNATTIAHAYRSYYTHEAGDRSAPEHHASAAWAIANGYLNRRYGYRRQPAWPAPGSLLMALLPMTRWKLDYYARHTPAPAAPGDLLFDFGCGDGEFMARAASTGWRVCGFEWDEAAARAARQRGIEVHTGELSAMELADASVARITMAHVVEHLHDPDSALRECRRLLRPGGVLWIATPSAHALSHRVYGSAWRGLETPRHLIVYDLEALLDLLRRNGFANPRALRRGSHSRRLVAESEGLAKSRGKRSAMASAMRRALLPLMIDVAAQFDPRWGEETVVVAQRPV